MNFEFIGTHEKRGHTVCIRRNVDITFQQHVSAFRFPAVFQSEEGYAMGSEPIVVPSPLGCQNDDRLRDD